jgi:hypothetical protein
MKDELEYRVVGHLYMASLVEQVNRDLADGWALQGGVAVTTTSSNSQYCYQALVRRKQVKK